MNLSDYILLTREERTQHLDLSSPCEMGTFGRRKRGAHLTLLNLIGVDDDVENWTEARIHRCHACKCGRNHGDCGNPLHIYIGTAQENAYDISEKTRKNRGRAMISARKEWKCHPNKEKFFLDMRANPDLMAMSTRKLAPLYGVGYRTIAGWKKQL